MMEVGDLVRIVSVPWDVKEDNSRYQEAKDAIGAIARVSLVFTSGKVRCSDIGFIYKPNEIEPFKWKDGDKFIHNYYGEVSVSAIQKVAGMDYLLFVYHGADFACLADAFEPILGSSAAPVPTKKYRVINRKKDQHV